MMATPEPKISDYPKTNEGFRRWAFDNATGLKEANRDKAAIREYVEEKQTSEQ